MNIYDTMNQLAKEIRESEEYLNFKNEKSKINSKKEYKEKIVEFEKARYEEQINLVQTGKNDNEKMQEIQNKYKELIRNTRNKKIF